MREWLVVATEPAIVVINGMALLLVIYGSVEAFVGALRLVFGGPDRTVRREVWLRYARLLVAALTFQLAADIIESSITTDWEAIARLGAIAVIRTFLNYFLERDVAEVAELTRAAEERSVATKEPAR